MKRLKANWAYAFYCSIGMTLSVMFYLLITRAHYVDECIIDIEGCASIDAQGECVSYINQHFKKQWSVFNDSLDQSCACMMHQFDWVQSVDVIFLPCSKAHITVVTHEPLYRINNDYVVTTAGSLVFNNSFDASVVDNLAHISVVCEKEGLVLSDRCKQFILQVPAVLLDRYMCVWEHDNSVRFYDKEQVLFAILFHPSAIPTDNIIQQCNILKQELIERCVFEVPRAKTWVADIRFKDQIVVNQEKKGGWYGANI